MKTSVKTLLTRNIGWKLFSLMAAFAMWFAMSGARELTTSITVPVQYRNIPKSLEISSGMLESVQLILRGPNTLLARVNNRSTPVVLDLNEAQIPGQKTFTLDNDNVSLPAGVVLERAIPAQIRMTLETRLTRNVPVHIRLDHVPDGKAVASASATPDHVTISGPESRVNAVKHVETDPVDVRTLDAQGIAQVNVFSSDPQVYFTSAASVKVFVVLSSGAQSGN